MKLSAGNIAVFVIAAGLTAFAFIKLMDYRASNTTEKQQVNAAADEELTKRMRNAALPEIQEFVSAYIKEPLPDDYEIPQFIIDAGTPEEANRLIGERYPEFYGQRGNDYLHTIGKYPVRWKAMIDESKAYRKVYAHTREPQSNN
jgi:predicted house-cleaning noncanonical NTP pyrophosphatase (MazG superfamily)